MIINYVLSSFPVSMQEFSDESLFAAQRPFHIFVFEIMCGLRCIAGAGSKGCERGCFFVFE
ncbi:MAG: hypothetical protein CSA20_00010 [Deltaproteobacteria bacterium]|nr:MAG: hypothetical protein CSA20_00010 [Deltaproteobacteria bacterium]